MTLSSSSWLTGHSRALTLLTDALPSGRAAIATSVLQPWRYSRNRVTDKFPVYKKLQPLMDSIEPDFSVANFRGEEVDNAYAEVFDALELGNTTPEDAATQIQQLVQAVLDKDPA